MFKKKFPLIPTGQVKKAINQNLSKLNHGELDKMIDTVDLLYEKDKLELEAPEDLQESLRELDDNIPSRKECGNAEEDIAPVVEAPAPVVVEEKEEKEEKKIPRIKTGLALFMEQFEENLLKKASAADIDEAKDLPKNEWNPEWEEKLPVPDISRIEFDMKDELIRQTIMNTLEDIKEIKEDLKRMEDKIDQLR